VSRALKHERDEREHWSLPSVLRDRMGPVVVTASECQTDEQMPRLSRAL